MGIFTVLVDRVVLVPKVLPSHSLLRRKTQEYWKRCSPDSKWTCPSFRMKLTSLHTCLKCSGDLKWNAITKKRADLHKVLYNLSENMTIVSAARLVRYQAAG